MPLNLAGIVGAVAVTCAGAVAAGVAAAAAAAAGGICGLDVWQECHSGQLERNAVPLPPSI